MRLTTRTERGKQVRVLEWNSTTSSDLGGVVLLSCLTIAVAVVALVAVSSAGTARTVWTVVAVVIGIGWALTAVPFVGFAIGVAVVHALAARRASPVQRVLMTVPAVVVGALLGLDVYSAGPVALVSGPAVALVLAVIGWTTLSTDRGRIRLVVLCGVGAVVAVGVGCTIFL